mmetsp:Transcript_54481/g.129869  ORF Transcript_54481/g.129869 Transcript_54481/m.129869 type:complete len:217 (+) Transcript_54481:69-719(+)
MAAPPPNWAPGQSYAVNTGYGAPPPPGWGQASMPPMAMGMEPPPEAARVQAAAPNGALADFETTVECLHPILIFTSFLPSLYSFILFYSATDTQEYAKDEPHIVGTGTAGLMGLLSLIYALAFTTGVMQKSAQACQVIGLARVGLAALWLIMAFVILIAGGQQGLMFCGIYLVLALLVLPEGYLIYLFTRALRQEELEKRGLQGWGPAPPQTGPQW